MFSILIAAVQAYTVLHHDKIQSIPATLSSADAKLAQKYQPYLAVIGGCVPFPAVDVEGNVSGGLHETGCSWCGCDKSRGQVYARVAEYQGMTTISYAWYFPKNSPFYYFGHRHDWQFVVLWLTGDITWEPEMAALSVSTWKHKVFTDATFRKTGLHPNVAYTSWVGKPFELFTDPQEDGGTQPLVEWYSLPQAAKDSLNWYPKWNCPISDVNHRPNLDKAYKAWSTAPVPDSIP